MAERDYVGKLLTNTNAAQYSNYDAIGQIFAYMNKYDKCFVYNVSMPTHCPHVLI